MIVWPFIVILVLAPLAIGGLIQVAVGAAGPALILSGLGWLGIAGAVARIVQDRRDVKGEHVRDE